MLLVGTAVVLFVLDWRLALATLAVIPLDGAVDRLVPDPLEPRLPPRARANRPRHGDARGGHLGHARRAVVRTRAPQPDELPGHQRPLPRRELRDGRPQRPLLPGRRLPLLARDRDRARLRRLSPSHDQVTVGTLLAFSLYLSNFFDPVQQLSQLYNTFLSATAALDKIMEVLDEEPEIVDAPGAARAAADRRATSGSRASASGTARCPRCCTGSTSTSPPARPSRSSARPARGSRRSRS